MADNSHDYIGPDPLVWIDRLRAVNETSQFKPQERDLIDNALSVLQRDLQKMKDAAKS